MVSAHQTQHTLIVNSGPNVGQTYILRDPVSTLGRSADNTIVLDSNQVSRYHAKVTIFPNGAVIEDTGSTNGTFVNGQRIGAQYQLSSGDTIGISDYITFQYLMESVMGVMPDSSTKEGGATVIMGNQNAFGQVQTATTVPQIGAHIPEFQPQVYSSPPSGFQTPEPVTAVAPEKNPTTLYIVIAVLVMLICLCVALAIFLWFAPEAFWRDLFNFFNIPWPTNPLFIV